MKLGNLNLDISDADIQNMNEYLVSKIQAIPSVLPSLKISEYAEEHRILPPGTPRPGRLDLSYTPYLIEPMNNMGPDSPIQRTIILKGAQEGFTLMLECIICYYIGHAPADQLLVSATDGLIERWSSRRLEPAIDSYGIRKHIRTIDTANVNRKKYADKTFSKEYFGMRLDMASAQSAPSLRSSDKKVLLRDEIDGAPEDLKRTDEGNWMDVSEARTIAWGNRKKIVDISTPTNKRRSPIIEAYNLGDKRMFYVPCPHCKQMMTLDFKQLVPEFKNGILYDVTYGCQNCGAVIYNYDKTEMLSGGEWRPTSQSISPQIRSYYINSMYSPIGMLSWKDLYQKYLNAVSKNSMAPFFNLYLGLQYREEGSRPQADKVIELKDNYQSGTVPDGIMFLTFAADVQEGMHKYARMNRDTLETLINNTPEEDRYKQNFPRIEIEILGHGPGWRNSSIIYKTFYGSIDDPYDGAWEKLNKFAETCHGCSQQCNYKTPGCDSFIGGLSYKTDKDRVYNVEICLIDSGDGNYSDVVYRFCGRWNNTYAIKGQSEIKKSRKKMEDSVDEIIAGNRERYKSTRGQGGHHIYLINTNHYKNIIYRNLKIPKVDFGVSRPGTMSFPKDYPERYFKMLVAEEKLDDGTFYCPDHTHNESLDIKVYNLCAGDIFIDNLVLEARERVRANGGTREDIQKVDARFIVEELKKMLNISDL